jgi:hypothetical protein
MTAHFPNIDHKNTYIDGSFNHRDPKEVLIMIA